MPSGVAYGSLKFSEQIAFFRAKKNVLTERWTDVWEAEHDHAFMVAGANRIDLLADLRTAVDKAIADGTGLEAFRRDFDQIVARYGWEYNGGRNWRTRVIFETNLRTSYAAGRYAQLQKLKSVLPYWRYRHSDAVAHPRPQHQAWNGLVLHADDPWWNTHYPPNGWGCQCTVEGVDDLDLRDMGKSGPDTAPPIDMQPVTIGGRGPAPRTVETPAGVDPGFGYAPGKSAFETGLPPGKPPAPLPAVPGKQPPPLPVTSTVPANLLRLTQETLIKATKLPALAGAEALGALLAMPRTAQALDASFNAWQLLAVGAGLLAATNPPQDSPVIGGLNPALVTALADAGVTPASAVIVAGGTPTATPGVPAALRSPRAVLLDRTSGQLLYVGAPDASGRALAVWIKPGSTPQSPNVYVAAAVISVTELRKRQKAGALRPVQGAL